MFPRTFERVSCFRLLFILLVGSAWGILTKNKEILNQNEEPQKRYRIKPRGKRHVKNLGKVHILSSWHIKNIICCLSTIMKYVFLFLFIVCFCILNAGLLGVGKKCFCLP